MDASPSKRRYSRSRTHSHKETNSWRSDTFFASIFKSQGRKLRSFLSAINSYSVEEMQIILSMIANHSNMNENINNAHKNEIIKERMIKKPEILILTDMIMAGVRNGGYLKSQSKSFTEYSKDLLMLGITDKECVALIVQFIESIYDSRQAKIVSGSYFK